MFPNRLLQRAAEKVAFTSRSKRNYQGDRFLGIGAIAPWSEFHQQRGRHCHQQDDDLQEVLEETDIRRLRISSLQPAEFSDGLLDLWSGVGRGRLCPHFHIPLQSGSDRILERMRRRYTGDGYLEAVRSAKSAVAGSSITTDVISGFPGESEEDHQGLFKAVSQHRETSKVKCCIFTIM